MRLTGKVALITGGARGIGKEGALLFAKEGAKVVIGDFDKACGEETIGLITQQGGDGIFVHVDVSDSESVRKMTETALTRYGKIDILVNNAGITRDGLLTKLSEEEWNQVIQVNLSGVFFSTQAVVPHMIEQGSGKIINTSSISGIYGNVGQTNYAAAKAAVVGMTKTWAKELGRKGICVNAVVPGFIETDMVAKVPNKVIQKMIERIPLQRLGRPSDIAKAYLFLASDESDYINGSILHVDGGITL
ncbi:3-oxoacyl-ACP reductase FabG [Microaerobacter geothermalis]|uniref:3-oxoacyl-ACP reductase FabG n=1 Tax=Microaerobacter geothermalis TaxID=674972 RepID=UPI001F37E4A8|nr:3-oxoacyl-ACP reductase FabG [Microaerobacter geothermalis]MCF6092575.1 3-oxoacyl-ACP reductase FabG [Microaerobacter geothermalis]